MSKSSRLLEKFSSAVSVFALLLVVGAVGHAQETEKLATGVISGKVMTRGGEPLSNARVMIRQGTNNNPQSMRVDSSGAFTSEPLEPGIYYLSVYAPGYIGDPQSVPSPGYYRPGDTANFTMIKGGVITGTVKNSNGQPLINIPVKAMRIRDLEGKATRITVTLRERVTDDRGVYRLYGLPPGVYVVAAGGTMRPGYTAGSSPYETDAPTYAPSSTRDTALEVSVNNGDEITADIQYRNEAGHIVSGTIVGATKFEGGPGFYLATVSLFDLRSHTEMGNASADVTSSSFSLYGVPDGEYELHATQGSASGIRMTSAAKQIRVQGSDVTGISLALAPAASISGRVIFESDAKAACGKRHASAIAETILYARRYEPDQKGPASSDVPYPFRTAMLPAMLDPKGGFDINNVLSGNYRLDPREPAPGWFVRSITSGPAARLVNLARDGLTVKSGERVSGVTITFAEGASQLSGKIAVVEGQSLASNLRVYLVPSERTDAENVLRFYEARVDARRTFLIDNLNPGKYFVIARAAEENEYGIAKSLRFDAAFRAKVVQDAQAAKKEIAFKPCEQISDYELPLAPSASPQ